MGRVSNIDDYIHIAQPNSWYELSLPFCLHLCLTHPQIVNYKSFICYVNFLLDYNLGFLHLMFLPCNLLLTDDVIEFVSQFLASFMSLFGGLSVVNKHASIPDRKSVV